MVEDGIVTQLRERAARKWTDDANRSASLFGRAADEIERLRTALRMAADEPNIDKARAIADSVLGQD